jgi:hypothetical protein
VQVVGPVASCCLSAVDATARQQRQEHRRQLEMPVAYYFCSEFEVPIRSYVTYRSLVLSRGGRRERFVMCSSSPEDARSWCAQAVEWSTRAQCCVQAFARVCTGRAMLWESCGRWRVSGAANSRKRFCQREERGRRG